MYGVGRLVDVEPGTWTLWRLNIEIENERGGKKNFEMGDWVRSGHGFEGAKGRQTDCAWLNLPTETIFAF